MKKVQEFWYKYGLKFNNQHGKKFWETKFTGRAYASRDEIISQFDEFIKEVNLLQFGLDWIFFTNGPCKKLRERIFQKR